jgi:hypothetical protein
MKVCSLSETPRGDEPARMSGYGKRGKKTNADWPIRIARSEGLGGLVRRETLPQLDQSTTGTWVAKKATARSNHGFFAASIANSTYNSGS